MSRLAKLHAAFAFPTAEFNAALNAELRETVISPATKVPVACAAVDTDISPEKVAVGSGPKYSPAIDTAIGSGGCSSQVTLVFDAKKLSLRRNTSYHGVDADLAGFGGDNGIFNTLGLGGLQSINGVK